MSKISSALGFALMSFAMAWEPGRPLHVPADLNSEMDPAIIERFLQLVSASPREMHAALQDGRSRWDFLAFQRRPVLRTEQGLLVLDRELLFRRVTAGLYWDVHDHLAATEGDGARQQWTQLWGSIVEAVIEDELGAHKPWAPEGTRLVWDEDDLAAAYGTDSKRCDLVVDLGFALLVADVVSGQLTVATRIEGDLQAFQADMEKLVFKKVRQVHETCMNLIKDETALTGVTACPPRRLFPMVAIGSDFARHPVISNIIEEYRKREGLLEDARIAPLSVIDVSEAEALEGLAALGHGLTEVLTGWHNSAGASMSLRNYLIEQYPKEPETFRSPRMRAQVNSCFDGLQARLQDPRLRPNDQRQ